MTGTLKKAEKLLGRKKYHDVIRLLEHQIFKYRESFPFYLYLGISCIMTSDFSGAESYLRRALQLKPGTTEVKLYLAIIHLRRKEFEECIRIWLDVLDNNPKNKYAENGLKFIKNIDEHFDISELFDSGKVKKFFPLKKGSRLFIVPVLLGIGIIIAGLSIRYFPAIVDHFSIPDRETEISRDYLDLEKDELVQNPAGEYLVLTEKEIEDILKKVDKLFNQYEDNYVQYNINKIKNSNASAIVKEKTKVYEDYLSIPDFTNFKNQFEYEDVLQDTYLYENCFVRWSGKIANLEYSETEIRFDFLVGYENQTVLQGIVPAIVLFPIELKEGNPIEVLARIVLKDRQSLALSVISIHKLQQ